MALVIKLSVSKSNSNVTVNDISGLYNIDDNPTGWGVPNIAYTDVVSATLIITNTFNDISATYNLNYPIQDPSEVLSFGPFPDIFGDGKLKVELTINTIDAVYTKCINVFFMNVVDCCIDKYLVQALEYDNLNDQVFIKNIMQAEAIRRALKSSAYSMSDSKIKYYLEQLNKICNLCACAE